jgi:parvulin-like peptidyl-prolyl isomerase
MPKKKKYSSHNLASITYWRKFAQHRFMYMLLAVIFAFGIVAYFGVGMGNRGGGVSGSKSQDVIALVNGEPVSRADYDRVWSQYKQNLQGNSDISSITMQAQILAGGQQMPGLIDMALLRSVAKQQGIVVTDADIDKKIADIKKQLGGRGQPISDDMFARYLQGQGMDEDSFRSEIRKELYPSLLFQKLAANVKVTRQDAMMQYEQVKLRQILISTSKLPDEQAKNRAEKILAEIKAGKNFADLANRYSDDPGNNYDPKTRKPGVKQGGEYNWAPVSQYVPAFAQAAMSLQPGQVSGLVKTQFGYHIILLEGKKLNLPKDFDKNLPQIMQKIQQQKAEQAFQELLAKAQQSEHIVWKDPSFQWKYDYGRIMAGAMTGGGMDMSAFLNEMQSYTAKYPDDSDAQLIYAQMLYYQKYLGLGATPGQPMTPPTEAQKNQVRPEIINAYLAALKQREDINSYFTLAQLYEDGKQMDKALGVYEKIQKIQRWDETPDTKFIHQRLLDAFKKLNRPDLAAKEVAVLAKIAQTEKQQAQDRAAASGKGAATTVQPGGSVSVQGSTGAVQPKSSKDQKSTKGQ